MKRILTTLTVLLLAAFAVAQVLDLPPVPTFDLAEWAANTAALAAAIVFLVAVIRKYVYGFDGNQVPLLSVALGLLAGAGLSLAGYFDGNLISGIIHGLSAGVLSFTGVDGVRSVVKIPDGTYNPQVKK